MKQYDTAVGFVILAIGYIVFVSSYLGLIFLGGFDVLVAFKIGVGLGAVTLMVGHMVYFLRLKKG